MVNKSGDKYVGGWKDGKYHGEGILYVLKDDEKQKLKKDSFGIGIWENNKIKVNYRREIEECEFDENGSIINEYCYFGVCDITMHCLF